MGGTLPGRFQLDRSRSAKVQVFEHLRGLIVTLAIMAIGGLGDLRGALLGGLGIGLLEAVMFYFGLGRLGEMAVWVAMIATLMFRPGGLFGGGMHTLEQRA